MTIKTGDRLPDATLYEMGDSKVEPRRVAALTNGRRVVIFGLPGAFTPTCSARHVPGYVEQWGAFKEQGVDDIICVSVNDAYVMNAWGKTMGTEGKVRMLADGSAELTRALGLEQDLTARGMGVRSQRYAMYADNGVVRALNVEPPGKFEVSDANSMLIALDKLERG